MEIQIPIKGGNYTYILDNVGKNHIETIELKYNILQKYYKNKDKKKLSEKEKMFYINYIFSIFDYLDYCKCPLEKGIYNDLKLLIHHLEDCYYNNNFKYNKDRLIKQTNMDIMVKDALLYLLRQFDNKYTNSLTFEKIKLKLIDHLDTIKEKKIVSKIINIKYPSDKETIKKINILYRNSDIKYIKDIDFHNPYIINKIDILIEFIIKLNNIYKDYIIKLEQYNANIINELYKLKF